MTTSISIKNCFGNSIPGKYLKVNSKLFDLNNSGSFLNFSINDLSCSAALSNRLRLFWIIVYLLYANLFTASAISSSRSTFCNCCDNRFRLVINKPWIKDDLAIASNAVSVLDLFDIWFLIIFLTYWHLCCVFKQLLFKFVLLHSVVIGQP